MFNVKAKSACTLALLVMVGLTAIGIPSGPAQGAPPYQTLMQVIHCPGGPPGGYTLDRVNHVGNTNSYAMFQKRQTLEEVLNGEHIEAVLAWDNTVPSTYMNQWFHWSHDNPSTNTLTNHDDIHDYQFSGNPCTESLMDTGGWYCNADLNPEGSWEDGARATFSHNFYVDQSVVQITTSSGYSATTTQDTSSSFNGGIEIGVDETGPSGTASFSYSRAYGDSHSSTESSGTSVTITAYKWMATFKNFFGGGCAEAIVGLLPDNEGKCDDSNGSQSSFVQRALSVSADGSLIAWTLTNELGDVRIGWSAAHPVGIGVADSRATFAEASLTSNPNSQKSSDASETSWCGDIIFENVGQAELIALEVHDLRHDAITLGSDYDEALFSAIVDESGATLAIEGSNQSTRVAGSTSVSAGQGSWSVYDGTSKLVGAMGYDYQIANFTL